MSLQREKKVFFLDALVHIRLYVHIRMHIRWALLILLKVDTRYTVAARALCYGTSSLRTLSDA